MKKQTKHANTRQVESILWYFQVFVILQKAWIKLDIEHAIAVMAGEWAGSPHEQWFSSEA